MGRGSGGLRGVQGAGPCGYAGGLGASVGSRGRALPYAGGLGASEGSRGRTRHTSIQLGYLSNFQLSGSLYSWNVHSWIITKSNKQIYYYPNNQICSILVFEGGIALSPRTHSRINSSDSGRHTLDLDFRVPRVFVDLPHVSRGGSAHAR